MDKEELLVKYLRELIEEHKIFYSGPFKDFIQDKFKDNLSMIKFLSIFHSMYMTSLSPNPRISVVIHKTFKYFVGINTLNIIHNVLKTAKESYEPTSN